MKMSSRISSPSSPIFLSPEPVDLGSVSSSSCSLNELDNISHLLRKISTDINEIKEMKTAILTVEANIFDLNVRVSQNEAKVSSLEVKMNEYAVSTTERSGDFRELQEEVDFESQSRTTDLKIIGFLRNIEKGKFLVCDIAVSFPVTCSHDVSFPSAFMTGLGSVWLSLSRAQRAPSSLVCL